MEGGEGVTSGDDMPWTAAGRLSDESLDFPISWCAVFH